MRKLIAIALTAVAVAGCGANNFDLEEVDGRSPDRIEVLLNVDSHPNIVRLCIDGFAFYTVSTTHAPAHASERLHRRPEWDQTFCAGEPR